MFKLCHYSDVIMCAMASQITSVSIVTQLFVQVQIKENIKAPRHWPLWRGINRWPVNSPHKGPVTRKMFPLNDVIMIFLQWPLPPAVFVAYRVLVVAFYFTWLVISGPNTPGFFTFLTDWSFLLLNASQIWRLATAIWGYVIFRRREEGQLWDCYPGSFFYLLLAQVFDTVHERRRSKCRLHPYVRDRKGPNNTHCSFVITTSGST